MGFPNLVTDRLLLDALTTKDEMDLFNLFSNPSVVERTMVFVSSLAQNGAS